MQIRKHVQGKKALPVIILIFVIIVIMRFTVFYFKSEGFSGLSPAFLPLFLGSFLFMFGMNGLFAAWVYEDCRIRGGDGILWSVIVFFLTPFFGMLVYFLRRPERRRGCPACGHLVSLRAKYCEECGTHIELKEEPVMTNRTHHLKYIIGGMICFVLMLACLITFIFHVVAVDGFVNTSVTSNERVWNTGVITMDLETNFNGVWKLDFKSASDGFIKEHRFQIDDPQSQTLSADIHCDTVPDGASLTLWLVQGDTVESVDVTDLSEPVDHPLEQFDTGRLNVRLEINGVEDVSSEIKLTDSGE